MVNQTLILHHVFTGVALTIMLLRLICRRLLPHQFNFGDYCTMGSIFCASTRGGMIHVVLTWGTNNISSQARSRIHFTSEEIYHRTIGSQLTLANRPIYNSYLWLQKLVLLQFFLYNFHAEQQRKRYLWLYSFVFLATWIAAQIVSFSECVPFGLYWQVVPAPGSCVQAQVQLVVLGVLNIITDFMLLALPLPTLLSLKTPWRAKFRLCILCALGLFIVAITIIRLPINAIHAAVQANRTTWASTELLASAIVVNAPVIYGDIRRRRSSSKVNQMMAPQGDFSGTTNVGSIARSHCPRRFPNSIVLKDEDIEDASISCMPREVQSKDGIILNR